MPARILTSEQVAQAWKSEAARTVVYSVIDTIESTVDMFSSILKVHPPPKLYFLDSKKIEAYVSEEGAVYFSSGIIHRLLAVEMKLYDAGKHISNHYCRSLFPLNTRIAAAWITAHEIFHIERKHFSIIKKDGFDRHMIEIDSDTLATATVYEYTKTWCLERGIIHENERFWPLFIASIYWPMRLTFADQNSPYEESASHPSWPNRFAHVLTTVIVVDNLDKAEGLQVLESGLPQYLEELAAIIGELEGICQFGLNASEEDLSFVSSFISQLVACYNDDKLHESYSKVTKEIDSLRGFMTVLDEKIRRKPRMPPCD